MDFGKMQKVVYAFVLSKQTEMVDYTKSLIESTDQFWVSSFDDLFEAINKNSNPDQYIDQLCNAIEAVSASIVDFYGNVWNHPTGYKPVKIKRIGFFDVTDAELEVLVKELEALR